MKQVRIAGIVFFLFVTGMSGTAESPTPGAPVGTEQGEEAGRAVVDEMDGMRREVRKLRNEADKLRRMARRLESDYEDLEEKAEELMARMHDMQTGMDRFYRETGTDSAAPAGSSAVTLSRQYVQQQNVLMVNMQGIANQLLEKSREMAVKVREMKELAEEKVGEADRVEEQLEEE